MIIEKDWITTAGLRAVCLIVEFDGRKNHRCGYVGVPPEHPFYGIDYSQQIDLISQELVDNVQLGKKSPILALTAACNSDKEFESVRRSLDIAIDCHGGLTYAGNGKVKDYPVEADLWWFGFDCAHLGDASIEPSIHAFLAFDNETVKSQEYVEKECESLATQIRELAHAKT